MSFSDTRIHQIELLLTLDYLLNYTDIDHPATQQDICRYSTTYGLKYDPKATKGNDVRRQRIGDCLQFLQYICYKYKDTDKIPFIINSTDSGKFYIEQKNHLNEEQIIKILAAVKNDKYTQNEDTELLTERLLDSLSNVHNRAHYKEELSKASKGVKKYNPSTNRKIRLVNKAFNEKKMLKIRYRILSRNKDQVLEYNFWYRVYKIQEFKNKPHAILIPIDTGDLVFYKGFIFDAIENLNIPNLPDKEVLCEDFEPQRDLDKLFISKAHWINKYYSSPTEMIEKNKMPVSGIAFKVGFYFKKAFFKFVKPSFEEFFSTKLDSVPCESFKIIPEEEVNRKNDLDYIITPPQKIGQQVNYYVVNTYIDPAAFMSWLVSDVHGDGTINISDMVEVVAPSRINRWLYGFYLKHLRSIAKKLPKEDVDRINKLYSK